MKKGFHLTALLALACGAAIADRDVLPVQAKQDFLRERSGVVLRDGPRGMTWLQRGVEPLAQARAPDTFGRATAVREFVDRNPGLYRLRHPETELELRATTEDTRRNVHLRFQQMHMGVPVRGAQLLAHFDDAGKLYAVNGNTVPTPAISATPTVGEHEALATARRRFARGEVEQATARLEFRSIGAETHLVHAVTTFVNGVERWETLVDTHSGAVLRHRRDVYDANISASGVDLQGKSRSFRAWNENGRFHLVDVTLPVATGSEDPLMRWSAYGDTYVVDLLNTEGDQREIVNSSSSNADWDATAVSAIAHVQSAYRYFRDVHGRAGIDDRNGNLQVAIHYGENYDNAYWSGKWLVFGDGGKTFSQPAGCADVVAHELTHGVIEHSAGLLYENQSGALNESLADVFAVLAEGRNWTLGEDCTNRSPGWLRNLENTSYAARWQPQHMDDYVELPNTEDGDWGGVHVNSGIPSHAAWLLMDGLSRKGIGTSISRYAAGKLYYHALTTYLAENAQFIDLRRAMLRAAADLYPGDAGIAAAVNAAFDAVGIVEGGTAAPLASAELGISSSRLDFGDVAVGSVKTRGVRVENRGSSPVSVHAADITDTAFTQTSILPATLAPGEHLSIEITFRPDASGTVAGTLRISHGNQGEATVEVTGTGVEPQSAAVDDKQQPDPAASGGGLFLWLLALLPLVRRIRRQSTL